MGVLEVQTSCMVGMDQPDPTGSLTDSHGYGERYSTPLIYDAPQEGKSASRVTFPVYLRVSPVPSILGPEQRRGKSERTRQLQSGQPVGRPAAHL